LAKCSFLSQLVQPVSR